MRFILSLLVATLLFFTFWFKRQQEVSQQHLLTVTDTLAYFRLHYPYSVNDWAVQQVGAMAGPRQLILADSLQEIHRIIWTVRTAYFFLIKQKKDGTVWLEYKHYAVKNPLTGAGHIALLLTRTIPVPEEIFKQFRQKLSAISFLDATRNEEYPGCATTGSLTWEAKFQNGDLLKHATSCRQSVQFAEACETMMRIVGDPELQRLLHF